MRNLILTTIFLLTVAAAAYAQCPTLTLDPPPVPTETNVRFLLTAKLTGGDPKVVPQFAWATTGGRALEHGNKALVDTMWVEPGTYITVTVMVASGYPASCRLFRSIIFEVKPSTEVAGQLPCPVITVTGPKSIAIGQPATYTAKVTGGKIRPGFTPAFLWDSSADLWSAGARIIGSSEGKTIKVDTRGIKPHPDNKDPKLYVSYSALGYASTCTYYGGATTQLLVKPKRPAKKVK
jgi:hypothetical protein